jgi:peptidoglycan/LPS O-acetylase OafA/YrhL
MSNANRLFGLDLLRGLAALLVLCAHIRHYVFQSYEDMEQAGATVGLLAKTFYLTTSLGHQAVIVFFALSGFLVGGKAFDDIFKQRFSWTPYLLRRLTRLWIVIVPALLLTLLLDSAGALLTGGVGYGGQYSDLYLSGPQAHAGVDHSLLTFLGNVAFVQTVFVPVFGTNGPMWSLANEFWYYVIFPLALWSVLTRASAVHKLIGLAILLGVIVTLPRSMLEGGVIWVAGAAAAWCSRQQAALRFLKAFPIRIIALTLLIAALVAGKTPSVGDLPLGIVVATTLPIVAHIPCPYGALNISVVSFSEISYTLYLTHFPLLTLIVMAGFAPAVWQPGIAATAIFVLLMFVAIVFSVGIWWCFERNTDRVYSMIRRRLLSPETTTVAI